MAKNKYKNILTKEFLIDQYTNKKLSTRAIAKIIGTDKTVILQYLKKHDIERRGPSEREYKKGCRNPIITQEYLYEEYTLKGLSSPQIAEKLKCSATTIRKQLHKFKILIRKHPSVKINCSTCEKEITRYAYQIKNSKDSFCSKKCFKNHRSLHNPMHNKETKDKMLASRKLMKRKSNSIYKNSYCCMDCAGHITFRTALYGMGTCKSCSNKGERCNWFGKTVLIKFCKYKNIWFKSSWEANFAKWCDGSNIKWEYEPRAFLLKLNNKKTNYTPDFYLPEFDLWIEVKGYWRKDAFEKYQQFQKEYTNINIELFNKDKLQELSIIK